MSDYTVTIRVSNARIRAALRNAGFKNVHQFCLASGIAAAQFGEILNLKRSPLRTDGHWRRVVVRVADALGVCPDDLFSERQKTLALKTNSGERLISESEMLALAASMEAYDRRLDLQDNAAVEEIAEEQAAALVLDAVQTLTPRQQLVLKKHYGLGGEQAAGHREAAERLGVTSARAQQIEAKAIRQLRHRSLSHQLRELADEPSTGSDESAELLR
jgi:DNA-directed RNA polymerase sigma subunit (sigma70/sigma32)